MSKFKKILDIHDRLLEQDIKRTRPWMVVLMFIAGVGGLSLGFLSEHEYSVHLVAIASFAVGVSVEKFAQTQVRRIERKSQNKFSS